MKRLLLCVSVVSSAFAIGGCPIYSTSPDYQTSCGPYGCYGGGVSAYPDATDCTSGCPSGYVCRLSGGQTQCVPSARPPSSDSGAGQADASQGLDSASHVDGSDAPSAPLDAVPADAATPEAASDAAESADTAPALDGPSGADSPAPIACNATSDCAGGHSCVDGRCIPQSELCSDTTQCAAPSEACVNGVCESHCSASSPCPAGYGCDFTRGVCSLNPSPCAGSGTSQCQGGSTCVEGRCVAPCANPDAGAVCPTGQVCVNGGCIPDESARFTCKNDGQSGNLATVCASTDICLHHDCYTACEPDAANPCADPSTGCKQVTVTAGTYFVCASSSSLGSDCDVAAGKPCSGGVCIDGYCR